MPVLEDSRASGFDCQHCKKTFSQKSSLIRHLKLCTRPRPISLRQKSCRHCSSAKAKCDLQRPICSRCSLRGSVCIYPTETGLSVSAAINRPPANSSSAIPDGFQLDSSALSELEDMLLACNQPMTSNAADAVQINNSASLVQAHDLSSTTTSDSSIHTGTIPGTPDWLGDQWMLSLLPPPDTTPILAKHSMQILLRVLRTWPSMLAKGFQLPPIFHSSVLSQKVPSIPLANCCTLVKMWENQFHGTASLVQDTITNEMKKIFDNFQSYDESDSLAALQAITIYTLLLVFPSKEQNAVPLLDPSIFANIQKLVYLTAGNGLVLQEELDNKVPSWDSWVHVTSKRRAVISLYLLHWSYSVYHSLPSFNCDELGFMPAPAAKFLWQANSSEQWEPFYKRWLAQWDGIPPMQHEFAYVTPGPLGKRVQLWLEDTDELGVMFLSIFNATEREPEFMVHPGKPA